MLAPSPSATLSVIEDDPDTRELYTLLLETDGYGVLTAATGQAALQEGRTLFLEGELDDAFQFSTVLSLPYVLDRLEPLLQAAMDGDPATEVPR